MCLICMQQISVVKEYGIRQLYDCHHRDKCRNLQGKARKDKVKESLSGLMKQRSILCHSMEVCGAAMIASYLIAN